MAMEKPALIMHSAIALNCRHSQAVDSELDSLWHIAYRRRLFILSTEAQLQRLYQSNVNYRSKNVFTPIRPKQYRRYIPTL